MSEDFVPTPVGKARITWYPAHGSARAVALLGHGSATGIESADLQALADEMEMVQIPSANHTFGTGAGIPRSATMTLITTAATKWIDSQLQCWSD